MSQTNKPYQNNTEIDNLDSILLVDDEPHVLSSLRRLLRKIKCQIVVATSGREGLIRLSERSFNLIISDARMPEMSGPEFLAQAAESYPCVQRILLTGYADKKATLDAIHLGKINYYSKKPWSDEDLFHLIENCVKTAYEEKNMLNSDIIKRRAQENKTLTENLILDLQLNNPT